MTAIAKARLPRPRRSLFSFARKRIFDNLLLVSNNFSVIQGLRNEINFTDGANHLTVTLKKSIYGANTEAVEIEVSDWHTPETEVDIHTDRGQINRRLKSVFENCCEVSNDA